MAALAGDLGKAIMGQSEAEKAFRPWWDLAEDKLLYFFVVMSMVTLPMTFLSNTPLDCTIHSSLWPASNSTERVPSHARLVQGYAKKYCTETHLSPFLLYLPFTLLLGPALLTACEKFFIGLYGTERKLEEFYSLLVKESLTREDVSSLESENVRDVHEVRQAFRASSACYRSYLYRTIAEVLAVCGLLAFFAAHASITGILRPLFDCDVHGLLYQCVVPNSKFFFVVHLLSMATLAAYFLCSSYNLLWILNPRLNKLKKLLSGCERVRSWEVTPPEPPAPGGSRRPRVRLDMYFDRRSRDFGLLMDLLAEASGLVQPLRILALFDRHFQGLWRPRGLAIALEEEQAPLQEKVAILVTWEDCEMAEYMVSTGLVGVLEYTIDIQPETEAPIKCVQYYPSLELQPPALEAGSLLKLPGAAGGGSKYTVRFDGLEPTTAYTIHVATELDGRTVVQGKESFQAVQEEGGEARPP